MTSIILLGYYLAIDLLGVQPRFAESNYVANQIRLQAMESSTSDINIVTCGSSLTARLLTTQIDSKKKNLNLGLDGSSAIFSSKVLREYNKIPEILVIEMNAIFSYTVDNDIILNEGMVSGTNKLAKYFPLVRAEYRPVTILYSRVKNYKDSKLKIDIDAKTEPIIKTVKTYKYDSPDNVEYRESKALEAIIQTALKDRVRIVLAMIPDGEHKRLKERLLVEKMLEKYDVEFLDLKTPLNNRMKYSDGLHLSVPSAQFVTDMLERALQ